MLKITRTIKGHSKCRLTLEGKLLEPWVESLRSACSRIERGEMLGEIELDLTQVSFIDGKGLTTLRDLIGRGALIVGASAFIHELLKEGVT